MGVGEHLQSHTSIFSTKMSKLKIKSCKLKWSIRIQPKTHEYSGKELHLHIHSYS